MDQRAGVETAESVEQRMVEACRAGPTDERASEALSWPALHLPCDEASRSAVLRWARWEAEGFSIREVCRERGWDRRGFYDRRKVACQEIADWLNELPQV